MRARLRRNGVPEAAIEKHISVIGNRPAMAAAIGWYRARGIRHVPVGPTRVPTLLIWGDADDTGAASRLPGREAPVAAAQGMGRRTGGFECATLNGRD